MANSINNVSVISRSDLIWANAEEAACIMDGYRFDIWEKPYNRVLSCNGGDYPAFSARLEFPSGWVVKHDFTSFGDWGEEHDIDVFSPTETAPVYSRHFGGKEESVHGNQRCWTLVRWAMTVAPEFF